METFALEKNLPHSVESERMVLGVVILNNEAISQAARLKPSDFFSPAHAKIWRAMVALVQRGAGIDPITLQEELRRAGELEFIGGAAYIASLFDGVPRFSNIENYVSTVKDRAVARQLVAIGGNIVNRALDNETDASDQLAAARRLIERVDDPADVSKWASARDAAQVWIDSYNERRKNGRRYDGIATGLHDLDTHLSGVSKGDITLIAARPGIGKTALLTTIAELAPQSIHNKDLIVGFFETELTKDQLVMRWAASRARVRLKAIREATMDSDEKKRLGQALQDIAALPVFIDDQTSLTPNGFRAAVQRLQKNYPGCEVLAIVDYIQMMRGDGLGYKDKRLEITDISHRLKEIVKDYLGCYLIAAASLNRMAEGRKDNEPELSDLRESGDLESDAATVVMLHRPAMAKSDYIPTKNEKVIAKITKGRFCGPGRISLGFDPLYVRFGDYIEPAPSSYSWRDDAQD